MINADVKLYNELYEDFQNGELYLKCLNRKDNDQKLNCIIGVVYEVLDLKFQKNVIWFHIDTGGGLGNEMCISLADNDFEIVLKDNDNLECE